MFNILRGNYELPYINEYFFLYIKICKIQNSLKYINYS